MRYKGKYSLNENLYKGSGFGLITENKGFEFESNIDAAVGTKMNKLGGSGKTDFEHAQSGVGVECKLSGQVALTNSGLSNADFKHVTYTKGQGVTFEFATPDESKPEQEYFALFVQKMNEAEGMFSNLNNLCDLINSNSIQLLGLGRPKIDAREARAAWGDGKMDWGMAASNPQDAITNLANKLTDKGERTMYVISGTGDPADIAGAKVFRTTDADPLNLGCDIMPAQRIGYRMRFAMKPSMKNAAATIQVDASGKVTGNGATVQQLANATTGVTA